MATDPLLGIAEELYALAPGEFTGTRNEWAKRTKAEGDRELAKQVGELRRPSVAAWVVNMLMRHRSEQMGQVLDLGASLRQAQADLDGEALRDLTRQRRQLTTAVTHQGRLLAGELGQKVTEAVADQVQATLHAAMVDEHAASAVRSGMLVTALEATGVGQADVTDAVAVPAAIGMSPKPRPQPATRRAELSVVGARTATAGDEAEEPGDDPDVSARQQAELERRRRSAQDAVDRAVDAADDARGRLRKAEKRVKKVQAATLQAADELDQARRRVAELEHDLENLDEEAAEAEKRRVRAEQRYDEAADALEEAQSRLSEVPDNV
jgi:DNA repair exonuclease SbcCD ATPase subunit